VATLDKLFQLVSGRFWTAAEGAESSKFLRIWRPVRESNPCRRREREAIHYNSKELRGMDTTVLLVMTTDSAHQPAKPRHVCYSAIERRRRSTNRRKWQMKTVK
jgi:hypothetical protein